MITSLSIAGVPPYDGSGVTMRDLRRVNFIFGGNGSGKSTLSRCLANFRPSESSPLSVVWDGGQPCAIEVYNEDFKRKSFFEDESVPGVFTLGSEDAGKRSRLTEVTANLDELRRNRRRLEERIGTDSRPGLHHDKEAAWHDFQETAWGWYKSVQTDFKPLLKGLHRKTPFATRIVQEHRRVEGRDDVPDLDELVERAASVLDETLTARSPLSLPAFDELRGVRDLELMERAIVAASDVRLAALIDRLGSSDWVKAGIEYQKGEPTTCVFCQQPAPQGLLNDLNALFDGAYEEGLKSVREEAESYKVAVRNIRRSLDTVLATPETEAPTINWDGLRTAIDHLSAVIDANASIYESKMREPSRSLRLQDESDACAAVLSILSTENERRAQHNTLVANRAEAKASLEADLWRYLALAHHETIAMYRKRVKGLDQGVTAIKAQVRDCSTAIDTQEAEARELNSALGNTLATVEAINTTLRAAGFHSFHLITADDDRQYKIVRPSEGGDSVSKTLSEGERTLLAFLYFYERVRDGSVDASAVGASRIVVIDDPIASVDADVMFLVAHLVRDLADRAASHVEGPANGNEAGCVQQLIVLTHNAHFHHAATHVRGRRAAARRRESYWTLAKPDGQTTEAHPHEENPVGTTYEMLWREVRDGLNAAVPPVSLQNAMRRIVEFYFVELGTCGDLHAVARRVPDELRSTAVTLVNWMNDGSHGAFGDAQAPASQEQIRRYGKALRALFKANGSGAHWDAMMGEEWSQAEPDV